MPCIHCPVCRELVGAAVAVCRDCETPHHPDCWEFGGGCAVFACGSHKARVGFASELIEPIGDIVFLDDPSPSPRPRAVRSTYSPPSAPRPMLPTGTSREGESGAVAVVGWVYLAASLSLAAPCAGLLLGGLFRGGGNMLFGSLLAGGAAIAVKEIGDLIAIGDGRGRTAHLCACLLLALGSPWAPVKVLLALFAVPFATERGRAHFARGRRP